MFKRILLVGLLVSVLAVPVAQALPIAWYSINGVVTNVDDSYWSYDSGYWNLSYATQQPGQYLLNMAATGKEDPTLSWGVNVTNLTAAPVEFVFGFTTPIIPDVTGDNIVYASTSYSMTDAAANGIAIAPVLTDDDGDTLVELQNSYLNGTTDMGIDTGLGTSEPGGGIPGQSYVSIPYEEGPQPGPLGIWSDLTAKVGFTLTGGRDTATLNGYVSILPVPEPASLMLLGFGLVGMSIAASRRRRG